jgi:recombination protein RecA
MKEKTEKNAMKVDKALLSKAIANISNKLPNVIVDANSNEQDSKKKILLSSPRLNYIFGGGFSYTRFHQIYGPESAGKTTLMCYISGELQKKVPLIIPGKEMIVYMDFERTFDPAWATNLGMNCDSNHLLLLHPDCGEDGAIAAEELIKTGACCGIILDSDAAITTRSEFESDLGKANFGATAKFMSSLARRFNVLSSNYECCFLVVSQQRADIGKWSPTGQVVMKSTGGDALRFYCSTRTKVGKIEEFKQGNEKVGMKIKVKNVKNKTGIPWRECEMDLMFKGGFDSTSEYVEMIIDLADDIPDIQRPSKVMYESTKYGFRLRGRDAFIQWLNEHPKEFNELKSQVDDLMSKKLSSDKMEEPTDIDDIEDTPESLAMKAMQDIEKSEEEAETEKTTEEE